MDQAGASERRKDWRIYVRLLREIYPQLPLVATLFLLSTLAMPLALLMPLPLKIAIDSVLGSKPLPETIQAALPANVVSSEGALLVLVTVAVLGMALADNLQRLSVSVLGTYVGEKLALGFRSKLFRHVQRLSLAYHDRKGVGDSTYRIHWDAACIQWIAVYGITPFLSAALTLAGMFAVTAWLNWQLAFAALAVAPPVFFITTAARRRLRQGWSNTKALESRAVSLLTEALIGLRVVKAFGQEDRERARFVSSSGQGMRARLGVAMAEGVFEMFTALTIAAGTAAILYLGVRQVQAGALTLGELVLVMAYLARLYLPFQEISKSINLLQSAIASGERAFALLDEPEEVVEKADARQISRASGAIAFEQLSFAYSGEDFVLRDVSFAITPGTRLAITGTTGAGKTTIVSLLMRFYDPTRGRILLDGVDLRDYRLADLRNQFSIVLQDTVLFSASIAENIAYARPDAREDDIVAAAKAANAHGFISGFADGYGTLIGERGMRLSGGQRQRIALARAFLRNAPILVLDEPTSSVDTKTESEILEAMDLLMRGRTTIMITHRLSAVAGFDSRLVIENGRTRKGANDPPLKLEDMLRLHVESRGSGVAGSTAG